MSFNIEELILEGYQNYDNNIFYLYSALKFIEHSNYVNLFLKTTQWVRQIRDFYFVFGNMDTGLSKLNNMPWPHS